MNSQQTNVMSKRRLKQAGNISEPAQPVQPVALPAPGGVPLGGSLPGALGPANGGINS